MPGRECFRGSRTLGILRPTTLALFAAVLLGTVGAEESIAQTAVTTTNPAVNQIPYYANNFDIEPSILYQAASNANGFGTGMILVQGSLLALGNLASTATVQASGGFSTLIASDYVNGAPWYGFGQTNVLLSDSPTAGATQVAGYFGLNFQTANGRMVIRGDSGNIGVNTTTPAEKLDVNGNIQLSGSLKFAGGPTFTGSQLSQLTNQVGAVSLSGTTTLVNSMLRVSGNTNPDTAAQGAYLTWNALTGATGETDFINSKGGGSGGFAFMNTASGGTRVPLMFLNGSGNLGIGTTNPLSALTLAGTNSVNPNNTSQDIDYAGQSLTFMNNQTNGAIGNIKMVQASGAYVDAGDMVFSTSLGALYPRMRITKGGDVGIGTSTPAAKLEVNGVIKVSPGPGGGIDFSDGHGLQTTAWTGTVPNQDYADSVEVTGALDSYEPGDVLTIDPAHRRTFIKSSQPYSPLVGGVYSTKPGLLGKREKNDGGTDHEVPMALNGIVPTKVSTENGPVHIGDLLVSSSLPGYAMKGTDRDKLTGAVLGKALGSLETGSGVIDVLIALQ